MREFSFTICSLCIEQMGSICGANNTASPTFPFNAVVL